MKDTVPITPKKEHHRLFKDKNPNQEININITVNEKEDGCFKQAFDSLFGIVKKVAK